MNLAYDNQMNHSDPSQFFSVGAYLRISREDIDRGIDPSESIKNQKELHLQFFAANPQYRLYDFYIDEDFTGQNFQRTDFERLLKDMEAGHVNMVTTKDLSRLGVTISKPGTMYKSIFR